MERSSRSGTVNSYQKVSENTYRYPHEYNEHEEAMYGISQWFPAQCIVYWTLEPHSSRVASIHAFNPLYTWNESIGFFESNQLALEASVVLDLTLVYS
ncbi:MAG: hypothetical protein ACFFD4_12995 [Candidatus Odinarchaeota archaeon]